MRYRSISCDLFGTRLMRRASDRARLLYIYVLTIADAEGRWVADAEELLDGCWSASHGVKADDVEAALEELSALGAVLLYDGGDVRCGWLVDWYLSQNIAPKYRDGSELPPPPVEVNSWEHLDRVRAAYGRRVAATGANVSRRAALAWFAKLREEERRRILGGGGIGRRDLDEVAAERARPDGDLGGGSAKDKACELLAPLFGGVPDGAVATVEGALAADPDAKGVIVAAATALRAKYDAGERVHASWLAREVLDLLDRRRNGANGRRARGGRYPAPEPRRLQVDQEGI
mgnify:FL=1